MFAIVPANGKPTVNREQKRLLVGKAKWLHAVAETGVNVAPSIVITREGWETLQAEYLAGDDVARKVWIATLFRLVDGPTPPSLVVRTSAPVHKMGLKSAQLDIPSPRDSEDAVKPTGTLAKAINAAFASYRGLAWVNDTNDNKEKDELVIVQAMVGGRHEQFLSRNMWTGALGPTAMPGQTLSELPEGVGALARFIDALSGEHMACRIAVLGEKVVFLSARAIPAGAASQLEAAIDRVDSGTWFPAEAVRRFDANQLPRLLHPRLANHKGIHAVATGLGVSPGAASGQIVFTAEDAARMRARGRHCILVVMETGPGDIEGMQAATGFVTARGGMTSHAAVIARVTGKPCVAGLRALQIDIESGLCRMGERTFSLGDNITIDGNEGDIFAGNLPLSRPHIGGSLSRLLDWADDSRKIAVRTNAETQDAVRTALSFGAEGIGLARSEHMFFSTERMIALRRLILSESEYDRAAALEGLVHYQAEDYADLFITMQGKPVNVRLFDPPLHEFLPRSEEDIEETAKSLGISVASLKVRLQRLVEVNPMLGHRGVRLIITYPEILAMQVRALLAGAKAAMATSTQPINLEIMVPFVSSGREVRWVKERVMEICAQSDIFSKGATLKFGAMIELPRACLRAGDIAKEVDFISFGTNDLTQTTYGISRDDAPTFLATYHRRQLYDIDPFVTIDQRGVGELIKMAIERGREVNPNIKIGICGEHAGEPNSLRFFSQLAIDYVSCSPYRVPIARLVLAQSQN